MMELLELEGEKEGKGSQRRSKEEGRLHPFYLYFILCSVVRHMLRARRNEKKTLTCFVLSLTRRYSTPLDSAPCRRQGFSTMLVNGDGRGAERKVILQNFVAGPAGNDDY